MREEDFAHVNQRAASNGVRRDGRGEISQPLWKVCSVMSAATVALSGVPVRATAARSLHAVYNTAMTLNITQWVVGISCPAWWWFNG